MQIADSRPLGPRRDQNPKPTKEYVMKNFKGSLNIISSC